MNFKRLIYIIVFLFVNFNINSQQYKYSTNNFLKNNLNDNNTVVEEPTEGQLSSIIINSDQTDCNTPVNVLSFDIKDAGTDGLSTIITNVRIKPASTNTASWVNNIQDVKIDNGNGYIVTQNVNIEDTFIDISINLNDLTIGDGHTGTIVIGICLNSNGLEDGAVLSFKVDAIDHGFIADVSGSQFADTFNSDIISNDFTILVLCQEPTENSYNLTSSNLLQNSVDLSWTSGNGENRIVVVKQGSDVDVTPIDNATYYSNSTFGLGEEIGTGNFVVYNGHSNSLQVSGLSENKDYYFKIFEFNCSSGDENYLTSGTIESLYILTTTKVNFINFILQIYPNPSKGKFKIISNNEENKKISISDLSGKLILEKSLKSKSSEIDMMSFAKGIYFINIKTQNYTVNKKIIIE